MVSPSAVRDHCESGPWTGGEAEAEMDGQGRSGSSGRRAGQGTRRARVLCRCARRRGGADRQSRAPALNLSQQHVVLAPARYRGRLAPESRRGASQDARRPAFHSPAATATMAPSASSTEG